MNDELFRDIISQTRLRMRASSFFVVRVYRSRRLRTAVYGSFLCIACRLLVISTLRVSFSIRNIEEHREKSGEIVAVDSKQVMELASSICVGQCCVRHDNSEFFRWTRHVPSSYRRVTSIE